MPERHGRKVKYKCVDCNRYMGDLYPNYRRRCTVRASYCVAYFEYDDGTIGGLSQEERNKRKHKRYPWEVQEPSHA